MHRLARSGYALYAASIGLSAFLLFALQPMAAKRLLPYFGGSSQVWAASLVFFTSVLFLGYAYVVALTSLRGKKQALTHAVVVILGIIATVVSLVVSGSLFPSLRFFDSAAPALRVIAVLASSVGIPYFLLSTTGPLLQYWYGSGEHAEPYRLYALSNAGSLLSLLAYPLLVEPHLTLALQEKTWAVLFLCCGFLLALVSASAHAAPARAGLFADVTWHRALEWTGLAMLPTFMLVATTTFITQLIAPVPLLWVIPLMLYLLTFILAFAGRGAGIYAAPLVLLSVYGAYHYTPWSFAYVVPETVSYLVLLFFVCLLCHGRLYERRPAVSSLPIFYAFVSLGGALGTACATLLCPLVFNDFYEFPLGLGICAVLGVALLKSEFYPRIAGAKTIRAVRIIAPFAAAALLSHAVAANVSQDALQSRDFYGAVQVLFGPEVTILKNGTTMHGSQPVAREWSYVPTTYYTQGSGIARAISYVRDTRKNGPAKVGVIGLGTGSVAVYCRPGDTFAFYEIDPKIETIARSDFSYLSRCRGSSVMIGDGRLVLAQATSTYDVLAVDAFTDDAIPVHLLTKEALSLYISKLTDKNGIVAIHTSNRYLALPPVLLSETRALGLSAMIVFDDGSGGYQGAPSQWVLISKNAKVFNDDAFIGVPKWTPPNPLPKPWTDDYSSLFTVLRPPVNL